MLENIQLEFSKIESSNRLAWLYSQDNKYAEMLDDAMDDKADEILDITVWIFNEILKLK